MTAEKIVVPVHRTTRKVVQHVLSLWRRETESEGSIAAEAADFWSSSNRSEAVRDLSHWRGHGRFAERGAWSAIGRKHRAMVETLKRVADRPPTVRTMIEWGPGGGSNAVAFVDGSIERFIGVDISQSNLDECNDRLTECGFSAFVPVVIPPDQPETVCRSTCGECDLFLSTAVFQHFPSQAYGCRVLHVAERLLKPGGLALIQIRYDDGNPRYVSKSRDYRNNVITFMSYRIEEFWQHIGAAGLRPISLLLEPEVNYAYYFAQKPEGD